MRSTVMDTQGVLGSKWVSWLEFMMYKKISSHPMSTFPVCKVSSNESILLHHVLYNYICTRWMKSTTKSPSEGENFESLRDHYKFQSVCCLCSLISISLLYICEFREFIFHARCNCLKGFLLLLIPAKEVFWLFFEAKFLVSILTLTFTYSLSKSVSIL